MSILSKCFLGQILGSLFICVAFANPPICTLSPGSSAQTIVRSCESGDATITLDPPSKTEIDANDSYHLEFKPSLFNRKRTIYVQDSTSEQNILRIDVDADRGAQIRSLLPGQMWILGGLASAHLKRLEIKVDGSVVIQDPLEVGEKLSVDTQSLYLLSPFSILNGQFQLRYQDGYLVTLGFPFQSRIANDYTLLESLSAVRSPTKRRAKLDHLPHSSVQIQPDEFAAAYQEVYGHPLATDYPLYSQKTKQSEQTQYLLKFVLPKFTDNVKKGALGEALYRHYMQRVYTCKYYDAKVGLNSFDAIHKVYNETDPSILENVVISEVKYAAHGNPILGTIKKEGREWRQLSLPYVEDRLQQMLASGEETRKIAKMVKKHTTRVKLKLAVFNPNDLVLTLYDVGNMTQSLLD